jgi:hypothetical protein
VVSISFRSQLSQAFEQPAVAMTAVITAPAPVAAKEIVQPNLSFFGETAQRSIKQSESQKGSGSCGASEEKVFP